MTGPWRLAALRPAVLVLLVFGATAAETGTGASEAGRAQGALASEAGAGVGVGLPTVLNRVRMDAIKGAAAVAGMLLLAWEAWARRSAKPDPRRRLRRELLVVLGLFAGLCWWDLLQFGFRPFLHRWDTYHYYVGGKYFQELGYTRLYFCTTVADAEDGFLTDARQRLVRDLTTDRVTRTSEILADPGTCTRHFTPARWREFKHDVMWFRDRMPLPYWDRALRDHGFNSPPAWLILGRSLADLAPASPLQIHLLTLLDPLLLLAMWGAAWWAFGAPATGVALLYWGTNFPAFFGWTGGAYLRQDWLLATVVGLGLLRRGCPAAAGVALGTAAMLRVFPVLALVGLGVKAVLGMWRTRRLTLDRAHRRLAAGAAAAIAVALISSSVVAGGWQRWSDFAVHVWNHSRSFSTNFMGLRMVVAYDHDTRVTRTADLRLEEDAFQVWKDARQRFLYERRVLLAALVGALSLLVARALRDQEDWVAAVLGIGLLPIVTAASSYYFSVLLVFGLVGWRRPLLGAALCALSALTQAIPAVMVETDVRYAAMSLATVGFVAFAAIGLARRPIKGDEEIPGTPTGEMI